MIGATGLPRSFDWKVHGPYLATVIMVALLFVLPLTADLFLLLQVTYFVSMIVLALSMGFIWGYGGIMCFGQSMFFGLGGYAYAVAVGNIGESTGPFFLAMVVPAAFAAILGYFMFFDLGLSSAITKYVAQFQAKGDRQAVEIPGTRLLGT